MPMNCPEWCSRQLFAFIMSGLTVVFLIVAVASPWYTIGSMTYPSNSSIHQTTQFFWWKGVYTSVQMKSGVHNNEILDWNDENVFNSTLPRDRYFICAGLAVGSLAVSLLLCVGVIVLLMCTCVRRKLKRILARSIKWYLAGLNVLVLVLSAIAFGSFIEYPSALEDASYCPDTSTTDGKLLYCDSFAGTTRLNDGTRWIWGPYLAWIFTGASLLPAFVSLVLLLLVRNLRFDRPREYSPVDVQYAQPTIN